MKKLALALLMILCVTCVFCACDFIEETYKISTESSRYTVTVGETVDFKAYFTITSELGENITVTDEMISAPDADLTKVGSFIVTCTYQDASKSIIISVENKQSPHTHNFADATCTTPKTCTCGATEGEALGHTEPNAQGRCATCGEQLLLSTLDLADAMAKCNEYEEWNFAVKFDVAVADKSLAKDYAYTYIYYYDGVNFYYSDVEGSFYDYIVYTDDNIFYYFYKVSYCLGKRFPVNFLLHKLRQTSLRLCGYYPWIKLCIR